MQEVVAEGSMGTGGVVRLGVALMCSCVVLIWCDFMWAVQYAVIEFTLFTKDWFQISYAFQNILVVFLPPVLSLPIPFFV